jgi:spermidine synthase
LKKLQRTEAGANKPAEPFTQGMRLMSFFLECPLETISTPLHPVLNVVLIQGRLQLCTEKAVYSFGDLYTNFRSAFRALRIRQLPISNVLLLGLGLGSIPELLEKKFGCRYHYTCVEIDEGIIDLARRYTLRRLESPFEIICTDAARFVAQTPSKYDLICADVFIDDQIPDQMQSLDFFEHLRRICAPDGLILFNCFALETADQIKAQALFEERFARVFPGATYLDVKTNWILINDKKFLL